MINEYIAEIHITMKRHTFYAVFLLLAALLCAAPASNAAQPSAEASISRMISAMKKHPSLDITFSVWNNGNSSSGSMKVAGGRFHLSTPEMKVWYDGKNQWAYSTAAQEVNLTEPSSAELAQTNPLAILSNLNRNFTFRRLKSVAGKEKIELVPKKKTAELASATLILNAATSLPEEIEMKSASGQLTAIKISSIKGGKTLPQGAFRFNSSKYPGVEVVDLR